MSGLRFEWEVNGDRIAKTTGMKGMILKKTRKEEDLAMLRIRDWASGSVEYWTHLHS